jgi:filamentous hemagglutinin family protein
MNHVYRIVWNNISACWQVVAESARAHGKSHSRKRAARSIALFAGGLLCLPAWAGPTGGQVTAGNATIQQSGASTTINQSSQNAAINWQSFSVGKAESVRFNQPNASAITLNRVTGTESSQILGSLTANGQVFILNPNGVLFGKGAQVNVGGIVASTGRMSDADFMAGNYKITGATGSVVNEGNINVAQGGVLALIAPVVQNTGTLSAPQGSVLLAGAEAVTLKLQDGSLVGYTIDRGSLQALADNGGLIQAEGGHVILTAKGLDALSKATVNHSGIIEAQTVSNKNGVVELLGDMEVGQVNLSGKIDASAPNGGDGGFVETSGAQLNLSESAAVNTLAPYGKIGTWLIDPLDIIIATGGGGSFSSGTTVSFDSNAGGTTTIAPSLLNSATSNVILEALRDISFNDTVSIVQAGVGLTARAGRNIAVNANISTNNGEINLFAGYDRATNAAAVNDGIVDINGAKVDSGTAARNIVGRGPSMSGLVGYWTFDGDAKDGSGNANNGSMIGGTTFTVDGDREIVKFGGVSNPSAIFVPNSTTLQFGANMSLAYWVRVDSTVGMTGYGSAGSTSWAGAAVAKSHDRAGFYSHMGTDGTGMLSSWFANNSYATPQNSIISSTNATAANSLGKWIHVAYTFTGTEAKMYINGVLVQSNSGTNNFSIANTQNLYFGRFSDSWYPLNGALDEVRLYNRTLTDIQIAEVYRGVTPVAPPSMNSNSGSTSGSGATISASVTPPEVQEAQIAAWSSNPNSWTVANSSGRWQTIDTGLMRALDEVVGLSSGTSARVKADLFSAMEVATNDDLLRARIGYSQIPEGLKLGDISLAEYVLTFARNRSLLSKINNNLDAIRTISDVTNNDYFEYAASDLSSANSINTSRSFWSYGGESMKVIWDGAKIAFADAAVFPGLSEALEAVKGTKALVQNARAFGAVLEKGPDFVDGVLSFSADLSATKGQVDGAVMKDLLKLGALVSENPSLKKISGATEMLTAIAELNELHLASDYLTGHQSLFADDPGSLEILQKNIQCQTITKLSDFIGGLQGLVEGFGPEAAPFATAIGRLGAIVRTETAWAYADIRSYNSSLENSMLALNKQTPYLIDLAKNSVAGIDTASKSTKELVGWN